MKREKNFFLVDGSWGRALTKILFLMGGKRGKGAIKLIIQDLCDRVVHFFRFSKWIKLYLLYYFIIIFYI
ncbi:hypothetical protein X927_03440 [Petrotoga mexicana DSM 14811]|uniref:Uncharacterized protein n=1 Tax=Petrotoga mexicana DSM 14811 TaxID=1122954 RepID=A0A2K1PBV2_9BACT|nr:hypothetical protein X927_03440 [Petrotoga mexicana DSM 14811]